MDGYEHQGLGSSSYVHQLLTIELDDSKDSPSDRGVDVAATTSSGGTPTNSHRPASSKNKPKPLIIVTRDSPNVLRSHVLEVSTGNDVVEASSVYARPSGRGVCVLNGGDTITNVTLRQPVAPPTFFVTLHGRFEILSLTGTVLPLPCIVEGFWAVSFCNSGGFPIASKLKIYFGEEIEIACNLR